MPQTPPTPPPAKPSVHLNFEDWLPYLADWPVPDAEKVALIQTLWTTLLVFVDNDWALDPENKCSGQNLDLSTALIASVVNSQEQSDQPKADA